MSDPERQLQALDFLDYIESQAEAGSEVAREVLETWKPRGYKWPRSDATTPGGGQGGPGATKASPEGG